MDIPPNTISVSQRFTVLKQAAMLENFQPHMHLRGKAMAVEAILPDGTKRVVSYVGNFNFNWMTNYIYEDDAAPVLSERHHDSCHRLVRQHRSQSATIPIRTNGSDSAIARSTKWDTRG